MVYLLRIKNIPKTQGFNVPESIKTAMNAEWMTDVSARVLLKVVIISVKIVPSEYRRPVSTTIIKQQDIST